VREGVGAEIVDVGVTGSTSRLRTAWEDDGAGGALAWGKSSSRANWGVAVVVDAKHAEGKILARRKHSVTPARRRGRIRRGGCFFSFSWD